MNCEEEKEFQNELKKIRIFCLHIFGFESVLIIATMICALILIFNYEKALITCLIICASIVLTTIIICLTIVVCKCIQPKKEKCNSYDEALTEMLTRKNNEKKEEKNNNEQNKD